MKLSLNWIQEFVDFEVVNKEALNNVVLGFVKEMKKHPDADKLNVALVDTGDEELTQIVCGGENLEAGHYVPVAKPGAVLPGNFKIKSGKIRGEKSDGMICAKEEIALGFGEAHCIWLMDEKTDGKGKTWTPGMPLVEALGLEEAHSPKVLSELVTKHTAEVEGELPNDKWLSNVVTGKLLSKEDIKGSDKLSKARFDIGYKEIDVIFGKVHPVEVGEILPIALPGAVLPNGEIKVREMLGVKTEGMIADDSELGIENTLDGLTRFPADTPLGAPLAGLLMLDTISLDIDNKSLTHRPDLWGHYGMAREVAAILQKPLKPYSELIYEGDFGNETELKITINDDEICPRFSACVLTGIEIAESPQWLKARLQEGGMNPINNIVDITNFVMLELGQPMHAYDRKQVGSDELTVDWGKPGVHLVTLEGEERELDREDPVIYNAKGEPLIIAGIKGGMKSGIHDETNEIILEAANWEPVMIRKTSSRHQLRTDASQRFEKSLDPNMTETAIKRALQLIFELCPGAKLVSPLTTVGSWVPSTLEIDCRPNSIRSKIGAEVDTPEMIRILKSLEFEVDHDVDKDLFSVIVPLHRATRDVDIEEDIVEEIARIHGYDKIEGCVPALPIKLPEPNMERRYKHEARSILAYQQNFTEMMNYSFYSKERFSMCGLKEEDHIKVLNYLSEDQTHMRVSMTPNMLATIAKNAREFTSMRLFEIGRTYKEVGDYMPLEEKKLIAAITGLKPKGNWQESELFYQAKGELEFFLKQFRIGKYKLKASKQALPYAHPKKSLDVIVRGKHVGYVFTVHPGVLKAFDIEHDVAIFALKFSDLVAHGRGIHDFNAPSKFPGMEFDVSALVPEQAEVKKLQRTITEADKQKLITDISLEDLYMGPNIPEGKKSLLFTVKLQDPNGTLTDDQFKEVQESAFLALEAGGAKIRGRE